MKAFPMFIRTSGRRVIVVGGGETAAQKARLLLKTDAQIVIAALELEDELADLVAERRAEHHPGAVTADLFDGAAMAFIGTGSPAADACLHALAVAARCPVNVVDQPHLCEITTPSIVDRDPLVVAIGTEGTAPILSRQVRSKIEEMLPRTLGGLAALSGRLRASVAKSVAKADRRDFWRWVFDGPVRTAWASGAEREAARMMKAAIADGGAPGDRGTGSIALLGAGPGARDLLTLRAVARLQEADVIFYDAAVDPGVLELARRDAERISIGRVAGAHAWPQDRVTAAITAEARKGANVVRLAGGDRAGALADEIAAARAMGLEAEIVPGVADAPDRGHSEAAGR